jgi:hypothetical protein
MLAAMRGLAIAIVLAVTRIARAEPAPGPEPAPADEARAAAIFQHARELAKAGQIDEACGLFDQSYTLDPALGTALNLADCLEQQGHLRRAWELFDVVARNSPNVPSRARLARQRADALVARLATLTVDVPAFAARTDEPSTQTLRRRSRVYLAGGIGAAGVAGLGVSLGLALSAKHGYDAAFDDGGCVHAAPSARCTPSGKAAIDRAGQRADLATGFAIGGAVLAGVAAALWWTAPREAIQVAPIATAREIGVGVVARF